MIFSSIILSLTGSRDGGGTAELFSLTLPAVFLFSQSYKRKTFILNKELVGFHFSLLILLTIVFLHSSTKGLLKASGAMISCYLDTFLMLIGVVFANISYIFGGKY